jgi:hypothetical protein
MGTARETTDPSETEFARHRRLPTMAGSRTAPGRAQACCLSRFNRGTDSFWPEFSRYKRTRQSSLVASCSKSCGNRSSLLTLASARRRIPRPRICSVCCRPPPSNESGKIKPAAEYSYGLALADGAVDPTAEPTAFFSSRFVLRASFSAFSASVNGPSFTIFASIEPSGIL